MMTVSLCVIAYNEEKFLPNLLNDLLLQTYPQYLTEIVLVDSGSEDNTKEIMINFKKLYALDYKNIKVLNNDRKIQATGWNIAITNSTSDVIIRIDAHTSVPDNFVEKNMQLQCCGEFITGGVRPCIVESPNPWKNTLLEVENSLFGSSISESRHSNNKKYVKSMFHAAYRKEVFDNVGLFNEKLIRTEDNEIHYRIRKKGYKLCFDPKIISYQYARSSLEKMIKQKFGNGYWIGMTLSICPKCLSIYHFVPFAFLLGILFTTIMLLFGIWQLSVLMWVTYFLFTLLSIGKTLINGKGTKWTFLMPIIFLILHISYGIGTLKGLYVCLSKNILRTNK